MPRSIKIGLNPLPWVLTPAGFDLSVPVLRTALEVDIPEQEQVAVRADESQPLAIEVLDQDRSVGHHSPGIVGGTAQNGLPRSSERDCGDDAGSAGDEGLHPGHPNQIGQPSAMHLNLPGTQGCLEPFAWYRCAHFGWVRCGE